jgi:hypothetical protein
VKFADDTNASRSSITTHLACNTAFCFESIAIDLGSAFGNFTWALPQF